MGAPGDRWEREADRVAERVTGSAKPRPASLAVTPVVPPTSVGRAPAAAGVEDVVAGPGRPLDGATRSFMEARFGHDFSRVRIHTDGRAAESSRAVSARAYTVGRDVVFGAGEYRPGTRRGLRLLAHELTHVVQQGRARGGAPYVARQCPAGTADRPWAERVMSARGMDDDGARAGCMVELVGSALGGPTVVDSTNAEGSFDDAVDAGRYTAIGSTGSPTANFDAGLNGKSDIDANQFGQTTFATTTSGDSTTVQIFAVLGPQALNEVGPAFTRMAWGHELGHARDFESQGDTPHAATAEEELALYAADFVGAFLDVVEVVETDTGISFEAATTFPGLFQHYPAAGEAARDQAFGRIETFYEESIRGDACRLMTFRTWLHQVMTGGEAENPLVVRLNGMEGMGLTSYDNPLEFDVC